MRHRNPAASSQELAAPHGDVPQPRGVVADARDRPHDAAEGEGAAPRGRAADHARQGGQRAHRRLAFSRLRDDVAVGRLFTELGPRFQKRPGGYLRILKIGFRPGDSAAMAIVQLLDKPEAKPEAKAEGRRGHGRREGEREEEDQGRPKKKTKKAAVEE